MSTVAKDGSVDYTFVTRYANPCPSCNQTVHTDTPAERDGDGNYVHVDCPIDLDALAGSPACPTCWLVGPCDCHRDD